MRPAMSASLPPTESRGDAPEMLRSLAKVRKQDHRCRLLQSGDSKPEEYDEFLEHARAASPNFIRFSKYRRQEGYAYL